MLKQPVKEPKLQNEDPAAFRRLCVETCCYFCWHGFVVQPPSGGCVLKHRSADEVRFKRYQPPSGGCVLKPELTIPTEPIPDPAAFRRLCVETSCWPTEFPTFCASRLQAAVC